MLITTTLDNATFHVCFSDGGEEFTGDRAWSVNRKQLAELYAASEFKADFFNDPDEDLTFDPELDDHSEEVWVSSADALIVFLAAASQAEKALYEIDYHGSPYWFFHDMIHAEYDSGDGTDIYINEESEERALPMGATLAAKAGVSISEILTELVKAQGEFKERFGYDFDAIESFLDSVEIVLK